MKKMFRLLIILGLVILPVGCGDLEVAKTTSPVWLDVVQMEYMGEDATSTWVAEIDVCDWDKQNEWCAYYDEFVAVTFLCQTVDPDWTQGWSPYLDVHIEHIRISFFRTDGGMNVPGTFDLFTTMYCQFDALTTHEVKILHADQKLEPPLIWLNAVHSIGYEPETGNLIIKGYCVMQFWGKDNAGFNVYTEAKFPVQFADWADE
ncbi:hypothetical protein ACFL27_20595 [candidate division CSSED10-310 bacterium]|uniref:Lipoprotein n=1 Tax=candidate division CSSED10-310 bacterium TaxID=2855610 RepID=A0ABV6Z2C6_UNCC1